MDLGGSQRIGRFTLGFVLGLLVEFPNFAHSVEGVLKTGSPVLLSGSSFWVNSSFSGSSGATEKILNLCSP